MKKTIGFDLDGVIYDFHRVAYEHLKFYHGVTQDFTTFWREEQNGGRYFSEVFWENFLKIPILYESTIIPERDLDLLNELANKYNIIYVTHRPPEIESATDAWFRNNKIPYRNNVYFSEDKSIPIIQNQCLYFVDDMIKNIITLEKVTNAILLKKVWHGKDYLNYTYIENLGDLKILL